MSKDYIIFLKDADAVKSADFDFYAYSLGLQMRVSPKVEDESSSGFFAVQRAPRIFGDRSAL